MTESPPQHDRGPRWGQRPRVAILGSHEKPVDPALVDTLQTLVTEHAELALVDLEGTAELDQLSADFVVVLGGDGSILRAARRMGTNQLPVLGVNLGKLGFLADVPPEGVSAAFSRVVAGQCGLIDHLMLQCEVLADGAVVLSTLGLNEAAVLAGPPYRMLSVELHIDGERVTRYSCDGLIISTPVGSTAHNLSAGGPILRKDLDAFAISAISPHTLTVRPVVDSADRVYELVVPDPNPTTALVVDGTEVHRIQASDRVLVRRAAPRFQLIEVQGQSYYRTLSDKLGWGGEIRRPGR